MRFMDKVKGGTIVPQRTALVDVVLPVVQLWIGRKREVEEFFLCLETERMICEISAFELGDVLQSDADALLRGGLKGTEV